MLDTSAQSDYECLARFESTPKLQWEFSKRSNKLLNARSPNSNTQNFIVWITLAILFVALFNLLKHVQLVLFVDGIAMPSWVSWVFGLSLVLAILVLGVFSVVNSRKNFRKNLSKYATSKNVEFSFGDRGIRFLTDVSSGQWNYTAIDHVDEVEGDLMIRMGAIVYFIPSDAFVSVATKGRFLTKLQSVLPPDKLNLAG
jgi:hypothetical protein